MMLPTNITGNFDRVREIAFSNLPIEEKMKHFSEFDEIEVLFKNNIKTVKNCFLTIEGFEEYAVNPFGEVISSKGDFVKYLSQSDDSTGYMVVSLCKDGKKYKRTVHRLVADTFLQNPDHKPQVNHIDGDKENNRLDNLEYCTALENIQHAYRAGLHEKTNAKKIRCIESGKIYNSQTEAAEDLNISDAYISDHLKGKYSQAKGYHFLRINEKEI